MFTYVMQNSMTDFQESMFILNWNGFKDPKVGLMGPMEDYIERIGWGHVDLSHAFMYHLCYVGEQQHFDQIFFVSSHITI